MAEASFLSAYCRACQRPRYRSIRPLRRTDPNRPEFFQALDAEAPAPAEGPMQCYLCKGSLVLIPDSKLDVITNPKPSAPVRPTNQPPAEELFTPEPQEPLVPSVVEEYKHRDQVETLFAIGPEEELKSVTDSKTYILIITNKRVVRVNKDT